MLCRGRTEYTLSFFFKYAAEIQKKASLLSNKGDPHSSPISTKIVNFWPQCILTQGGMLSTGYRMLAPRRLCMMPILF